MWIRLHQLPAQNMPKVFHPNERKKSPKTSPCLPDPMDIGFWQIFIYNYPQSSPHSNLGWPCCSNLNNAKHTLTSGPLHCFLWSTHLHLSHLLLHPDQCSQSSSQRDLPWLPHHGNSLSPALLCVMLLTLSFLSLTLHIYAPPLRHHPNGTTLMTPLLWHKVKRNEKASWWK